MIDSFVSKLLKEANATGNPNMLLAYIAALLEENRMLSQEGLDRARSQWGLDKSK